jgi:hypothetical protein
MGSVEMREAEWLPFAFHPPFPDHMHHSGTGQNNAGATKIPRSPLSA